MDRILHLFTAIIIFAFVLFITLFTTRWVAGYAKKQQYNKNIELIETFKIAPSKYVAIVRTAKKYLVLGIGKDEVTFLSELPEDSIEFKEAKDAALPDFSRILDKARGRKDKKDSED